MAVEFRFSPLMQRAIRSEGWAGQGLSSLQVARDALLDTATSDEAVSLAVENYVWEGQFIYRSYYGWIGHYLEDSATRFGEAAVWDMLESVGKHLEATAFPPICLEIMAPFCRAAGGAIHLTDDDAAVSYAGTEKWLRVASLEAPLDLLLETLRHKMRIHDRAGVLEMLERYHVSAKPVHDVLTEFVWLWMSLVAERFGESVMLAQLEGAGERLRGASLRRQASLPIEELVLQMSMAMRGHRCGPGEEGDIAVTEDEEKYVISFDACGSGGRMRRRGEIDGLPSRLDAPFNFGVVKEPSPASWGQAGVPYYCTHCALWSEVMTTDMIGYPARITLFDPDGTKPCGWAIYKRPEDIPQEYFDRIGRKREPARFNKLPEDVAVVDSIA